MGSWDLSALKTADHFTLLLYPFQHALSGARREALAGRWQHWWGRLNDDELARALDDVYFFLPHVHRVLFPETRILESTTPGTAVQKARQLSNRSPGRLARHFAPESVLRLTCAKERLEPLELVELSFVLNDAKGTVLDRFAAHFKLLWVDAILFPYEIGFLVFKIRLTEPAAPSVALINDLHYYLRTIHPPKIGWQTADWRLTVDGSALCCKGRDVIDYLLQGLTNLDDPRSTSLKTALVHLERTSETARATGTPFGQVYGQSLKLYQYSCLAGSEPVEGPAEPFGSVAERLLYELATCTDTRESDYRPFPAYSRALLDRHQIALWKNWQGMALHDNVVFLGMQEGRFTLSDLPHNVESDYFYLYILTLFYKNRLSIMSGEMMGRQVGLGHRVRRARLLWRDFRAFQDDYWFGEVTHKPQGLEIHRKLREGLGVIPIFNELRAKVREYQEFHELTLERRVGDLLAMLTFVGIPAGALCSLFGSALKFEASWGQFFASFVVVEVVIGVIWLAWTHREEISERERDTFG